MKTFEDLLAPVTVEAFERDSFGQSPQLISGDTTRFEGLFDWAELNDMLERDVLRPPRVRLIAEREPLSTDRYVNSADGTQSLNASGLTDALRDGAVMVIDTVDRLFPKRLRGITESLSAFTRAESQVNFYCGWQASKGFKVHWDRHDVWVMQIEGEKSWEIWEPTSLHPLPGETAPEPTGDPSLVLTLTQGDLLYVPRGWWHRAEALDGVSVHLTLGSRAPTASDFVRTMKYQRQERPEWGAPLRAGLDASVQQEIDELTSPDALQAFLDNEAARTWTRPAFDLPAAVTVPKAAIGGSAMVKLAWTHGLEFRDNGDGTMRVSTVSLHSECDRALQPYLARVSGTSWQRIDEIAAGIEDKNLRRKLMFFLTTLEMKSALLIRAAD